MSGARDADRPTHADPVIVVGAGWSGLAAAVALTRATLPVALLDAAPQAGGRARRLDLELAGRSVALDNGQHLMVGAYRDTLALARSVGASERALQRLPMRLRSTDGLALDSPRLPAPLHLAAGLLRARGFMPGDRLRLLRLASTARHRHGGRMADGRPSACAVAAPLLGAAVRGHAQHRPAAGMRRHLFAGAARHEARTRRNHTRHQQFG